MACEVCCSQDVQSGTFGRHHMNVSVASNPGCWGRVPGALALSETLGGRKVDEVGRKLGRRRVLGIQDAHRETIVGTWKGVMRTRTVRRKPAEVRLRT